MENTESLFDRALHEFGTFVHNSKQLFGSVVKHESFDHDLDTSTIDEREISKLKRNLEAIRAALRRADDLSLCDEYDRLWMKELRYIKYCAEDVVDKFQFESIRAGRLAEFKEAQILASTGKRKQMAQSWFSFRTSNSLEQKIEKIRERYHEIGEGRNNFRLREEDGMRRPQPSWLNPSSSLPKNHQLHGRKEEKNKVIDLLLNGDIINAYSTIPIVGMAGIGKTTLVQHIYLEESIQSAFDLKIWVYVSQQYNVVEVTRKIIEGIEHVSPNIFELDPLHLSIIGHLKGKRFLLVLDDMWDEDPERWRCLQAPLNHGEKGSKVIVTTRSIKVGQMLNTKRVDLCCLSDETCWAVCWERACRGNRTNLDTNMIEIGKTLSAWCKGLPLAAEAVGAALSISLTENHWTDVLENPVWLDDEVIKKILPAIRVSYDYLPLHLKQCFAYCSLFPKGYVFQKDMLVQLWIAQGYFHHDRSCALEEMGHKYFYDLVERCFFQHSPSHYPSEGRFVMHDIYHALGESVSGTEFSRIEDHKLQKLDENIRHSSLVRKECHYMEVIQLGSFGGQDLRTFLFVGESTQNGNFFCMKFRNNLFMQLECLRVLDLSNTDIENLPGRIENLIHLRYLSVENTRIKTLPDSIACLFNLQTLNLKHCYYLENLPMGMKLLDNLRHLYLPLRGHRTISMPSGMGQMTSLQTLPMFIVGKTCGIEELGSLVNLKGELHILGIDQVTDANCAKKANLHNKAKLKKLTLEWSMISSTVSRGEIVSDVLEELRPYSNINELIITGFCGTNFPSWLRDRYLGRLVTLEFKRCRNVEKIPSLGQLPSLKHLFIQSMARLKQIGHEFCGHINGTTRGFSKLETLVFKNMDAWEEWTGVEMRDFPCLKSLILNRCEKLRGLPFLPSSAVLKVVKCPLLNTSDWQLLEAGFRSMDIGDVPLLALSQCGHIFKEVFVPYQEIQRTMNFVQSETLQATDMEELAVMLFDQILRISSPVEVTRQAHPVARSEPQAFVLFLVPFHCPLKNFCSVQLHLCRLLLEPSIAHFLSFIPRSAEKHGDIRRLCIHYINITKSLGEIRKFILSNGRVGFGSQVRISGNSGYGSFGLQIVRVTGCSAFGSLWLRAFRVSGHFGSGHGSIEIRSQVGFWSHPTHIKKCKSSKLEFWIS
ncbi:hypothetical protein LUZ60_016368 [Juncus effusus]|nr:hypothetical protein LUZ60_016368 [Juncus effusus]